MGDLLEVLFEYRGSKRELIVESAHLCEDVESELEVTHGISRPTVALSAAAFTSSSKDSCTTLTERSYFLLQKWCSKWKEYVDVEHTKDVKERDKLTVVKIFSTLSPSEDPDTKTSVAEVYLYNNKFYSTNLFYQLYAYTMETELYTSRGPT